MLKVSTIRRKFLEKYKNEEFVIDKTGSKIVEIVGVTFKADENYIIRKPNVDYIKRELEWYLSQSLDVNDIPGETPTIWKQVSSINDKINSNYGWVVFSDENYNQFDSVVDTLIKNPYSRRAVMIYNRPSIQKEYNKDGMSDFICTYANSFLIRNNKLHSHFLMRSNDAVFGYNNDWAWAKFIQKELLETLKEKSNQFKDLELGNILWTATSLHVYERHFKYFKGLEKEYKFDHEH